MFSFSVDDQHIEQQKIHYHAKITNLVSPAGDVQGCKAHCNTVHYFPLDSSMPNVELMIVAPFSTSSSSKKRLFNSRLLSFLVIIKNIQTIIAKGVLIAMQMFCISGDLMSKP